MNEIAGKFIETIYSYQLLRNVHKAMNYYAQCFMVDQTIPRIQMRPFASDWKWAKTQVPVS